MVCTLVLEDDGCFFCFSLLLLLSTWVPPSSRCHSSSNDKQRRLLLYVNPLLSFALSSCGSLLGEWRGWPSEDTIRGSHPLIAAAAVVAAIVIVAGRRPREHRGLAGALRHRCHHQLPGMPPIVPPRPLPGGCCLLPLHVGMPTSHLM